MPHDGSSQPEQRNVVDVIAPAGPFDAEAFKRGLQALWDAGFAPRHRDDIFDRDGFLAGSDERRRTELLDALRAPDSRIVWCARGGYGTTRLLPDLPLDLVRDAGKLLVGFSDITALHARWFTAGVSSLHGSMITRLATEPDDVVSRLFSLVRGEAGDATGPLEGRSLVPGSAEGVLFGGNLALLAALCGTPFQPDLRGTILFLEDIGERPYRIDRLLTQCRQAGLLDGIAGLALGEFSECAGPEGATADAVLSEFAQSLGVPTISALPCGHGRVNMALPFGRPARLDSRSGLLHVEVA